MKALVTGGAGFIGSHIVESLLKDGHQVVCMDDLSAGKIENIFSFFDKHPEHFEFERMDITNPADVDYIMSGVDVVFHNAASKKNICLKDPARDLEVNGKGTLNLLGAARKHGVKKFVHASTGSVYGEPQTFPQTEDHPLCPCSYYGVSKLAGERYVAMYDRMGWLNTVILRYFHVYGPRQDDSDDKGGVVSIFMRRALDGLPLIIYGDGTQQRSFTHVSDIVKLNRMAAEGGSGVYNCASGIQVTVQELADLIKTITGSQSPVVYKDALTGDIKDFYICNARAQRLIGSFHTDLVTGIEDLYGAVKQAV